MELEKMQYSPLEKAQLSCMTLINVHMKSIMFCMSQRSEIRLSLNIGRGSMASRPLWTMKKMSFSHLVMVSQLQQLRSTVSRCSKEYSSQITIPCTNSKQAYRHSNPPSRNSLMTLTILTLVLLEHSEPPQLKTSSGTTDLE